MKSTFKAVAVAVLLLGPPIALSSDAIRSPSGRHVIEFESVPQSDFKSPHIPQGVPFFRYLVRIRSVRDGRQFEAKYNDVRDIIGDKPEDLRQLAGRFTWSAEEDFVMFPEEDWPAANSSPFRQAVNLRSDFHWSTATVHMHDAKWLDGLTMAGNATVDCGYTVKVFNGRSGKLSALQNPITPLGYELLATSSKTVSIGTMLDNCESEGDREKFIRKCEVFEVDTLKGQSIACPK